MKFATKRLQHYPSHLVVTLPWEIENSNFWPPVNCVCVLQRFKQLINTTLCPAFLRKFVCQPLLSTPSNTNFLLISCPHRWTSCWLLLTNIVVTSPATNFLCHKSIAKVN